MVADLLPDLTRRPPRLPQGRAKTDALLARLLESARTKRITAELLQFHDWARGTQGELEEALRFHEWATGVGGATPFALSLNRGAVLVGWKDGEPVFQGLQRITAQEADRPSVEAEPHGSASSEVGPLGLNGLLTAGFEALRQAPQQDEDPAGDAEESVNESDETVADDS